MTILAAAATAFFVTLVLGRILIPILRRMKAGQSIKEDGPTWHMSKQGTPTMGGLMFIGGIAAAMFTVGLPELKEGSLSGLLVLIFALVFGFIGFLDDYSKIKKKQNTGLTAPQKFLLQVAVSIAFTVLLRYTGFLTPNLYIPFLNVYLILPWWLYMTFAAFVMVATVNAVNLTDGADGLAAGVTLPVSGFFTALAALGYYFWQRPEYGSLALFSAALFGGLLGFLPYNYHPAKVFMGDTGSLFLGGTVCGLAFALDVPLIIVTVGIIYVAEALSDVLQVSYFKATHGRRIFRMAPLHHHFEMGGWSEKKLFFVFSGVTTVFCLITLLGMLIRYPAV